MEGEVRESHVEEVEAEDCDGCECGSKTALSSVMCGGQEEGEDDEGVGEGVERCDESLVSCDGKTVDEFFASGFGVWVEQFP